MAQIYNEKSIKILPRPDARVSELDTIGTLQQFSSVRQPDQNYKKDFYTPYYRTKNLLLRDKLSNCANANHPSIISVCKQISCCSQVSAVGVDTENRAKLLTTSPRCKSKYCQICARIQSNETAARFINLVKNPAYRQFFEKRYFYFLTLTLKHSQSHRSDIYLKELRTNVTQLLRSELFKKSFIKSNNKNNYGAIQSTELTISKRSYHIHTHLLLCSLPIEGKVNDLQQKISKKWLDITGDSSIVSLDLIKNITTYADGAETSRISDNLLNVAKELFKYVVKSNVTSTSDSTEIDMLADWIIDTKGKNMVNALGFFKGKGINKSRMKEYDIPGKVDQLISASILLTKTISLAGPSNNFTNYSTAARRDIVTRFVIERFAGPHVDITALADQLEYLMKSFSVPLVDFDSIVKTVKSLSEANAKYSHVASEFDSLLFSRFNKV